MYRDKHLCWRGYVQGHSGVVAVEKLPKAKGFPLFRVSIPSISLVLPPRGGWADFPCSVQLRPPRCSSSPDARRLRNFCAGQAYNFLIHAVGTSAPNSLNGLFRAGLFESSLSGLSISTGFASLVNSQLSSLAVNSPTTFSRPSSSCDGSGLPLISARRNSRRQKMAAPRAMRTATPPTTPPTTPPAMAPAWDLEGDEAADDGDEDGDGLATGMPRRRERPGWAKPEAGCF